MASIIGRCRTPGGSDGARRACCASGAGQMSATSRPGVSTPSRHCPRSSASTAPAPTAPSPSPTAAADAQAPSLAALCATPSSTHARTRGCRINGGRRANARGGQTAPCASTHLELAPGPYPPAIGPLSVTPPAVGRITTMTIRYPPDSLIDIGCWTRTISGSYRADSERGRSGIGPTARGVTDSGPTASRQWCR
jgi:hypothetical protein